MVKIQIGKLKTKEVRSIIDLRKVTTMRLVMFSIASNHDIAISIIELMANVLVTTVSTIAFGRRLSENTISADSIARTIGINVACRVHRRLSTMRTKSFILDDTYLTAMGAVRSRRES